MIRRHTHTCRHFVGRYEHDAQNTKLPTLPPTASILEQTPYPRRITLSSPLEMLVNLYLMMSDSTLSFCISPSRSLSLPINIYVCTHSETYTNTHPHTCIPTCMHIYIHIYIHTHRLYIYSCSLHTRVRIIYTYICI